MAQTLQGDKSDITKRPFKVVSKDTKKVLLKEILNILVDFLNILKESPFRKSKSTFTADYRN